MGEMDDIVKDFLVESNENLDQLDRDLVTLEKDPTARDVLASIFEPFTPSRVQADSWGTPDWGQSPMWVKTS